MSSPPTPSAPLLLRPEARVGTSLLGRWTLEGVLGTGGMATVYRARHALGRIDAVKILHPALADDGEVVKRFAFEARAANRLSHPGAVAILDSDVSEDGLPFLAMELLEGMPLSRRLSAGPPMDQDELLRIVDEILDVLVAAHALGIIHRDVKPANVFLTQDGRVKLLDFGIAKAVSVEHSIQTMPGSALGTLGYMAPEQVIGKAEPRSDVFSVGATMFRMLTGRPVHPGKNLVEALRRVATEAAPPLESLVPGVSRDLAGVVDLALAFQLDRRYPDAATLQRDVRALRRREPPPYARGRLDTSDEDATRRVSIVDERTSERSAAERLVGSRLHGGYVLTRLLGRGGMGAVYESRTSDGQPCAVKVILHHGDADGTLAEERFRREAALAARIQHPNVVRTFAADVDRHAGHPYFVMELLEGRDLSSYVKELGPLETTAAVRLFVQAARGVAAAHALGIIHRDLKPANLFLARDGDEHVVKICDFGLAKSMLADGADATHSLTKSGGALLGTPQYTAPEQAMQAKDADHRADVWGLAISLYEALSGRKPWEKCETLAQLLLAICTESVPRLEGVAPWVDPALAAVVHRGLERDRERRFATVDEFARALAPFAGGQARIPLGTLVGASKVPLVGASVLGKSDGHSLSQGASLDVLASSAARASRRDARPLLVGIAMVVVGVAAGWVALRPSGATPASSVSPSSPPSEVESPVLAATTAPSAAVPSASAFEPSSSALSPSAAVVVEPPVRSRPSSGPAAATPAAPSARPSAAPTSSTPPSTTTVKPGIQLKTTW